MHIEETWKNSPREQGKQPTGNGRGSFNREHGNLCFICHTMSQGFMNGTRDKTLFFKEVPSPFASFFLSYHKACSSWQHLLSCWGLGRCCAKVRAPKMGPPRAQVVFLYCWFHHEGGLTLIHGQPHFSLLHQFHKQGNKSTKAVPKWPHQTLGSKAKPKIACSV